MRESTDKNDLVFFAAREVQKPSMEDLDCISRIIPICTPANIALGFYSLNLTTRGKGNK